MNIIDLKEEKIGKSKITHLKINETNIDCIKKYSIRKKSLYSLEFTVTMLIDPNKSRIEF